MNRISIVMLVLFLGTVQVMATLPLKKTTPQNQLNNLSISYKQKIEAIENFKSNWQKMDELLDPTIHQQHDVQLKSSQENLKKLDSIANETYDETTSSWYISSNTQYTYDPKNNYTTKILYTYWTNNPHTVTSKWQGEYSYDSNGNTISTIASMLNGTTQKIEYGYKEVVTYNESNLKTNTIDYSWDTDLQQWNYASKFDYEYNESGFATSAYYYTWVDSLQQWKEYMETKYTRDSVGNKTQTQIFSWDDEANTWYLYSQYNYTYYSNNQISAYCYYIYDDEADTIMPTYKVYYEYNSNGDITLHSWFTWDSGTLQWVETGRTEKTYDENGNTILGNYYSTSLTGTIELYSRSTSSYNNNNNQTSYSEYYLNDSTSELYEAMRIDYEYNSVYDLISQTEYLNNSGTGLSLYSKIETEYNTDYSNEDLLITSFLSSLLFTHMITENSSFLYSDSVWAGYSTEYYYYSDTDTTSSSATVTDSGFKIYPNPSGGQVCFTLNNTSKTATLEVFNLQGQRVKQEEVTDGESVSLQLVSGVYLYKVSQNGETHSGKLVIR